MIELVRTISVGMLSLAFLILSALLLAVVIFLVRNVIKEWRRRP